MPRPPEAPKDASPMSSTPPTSFQPPPEPAVFARDVRRTSRGAVLALLGASLLSALIAAVVVVVPLVRQAREQADAAILQLDDLDLPTLDPAPGDAPAVTEPVDGRYGLDTSVWFGGAVRIEGAPAGEWGADPADPARWVKGECRCVRTDGGVASFGVPDATTTDREWTVEDIALTAALVAEDAAAVGPRGKSLDLTVPTSDGNVLEVLGQVYDVTAADDGGQLEVVYAARALARHDLTLQLLLVCPAGTLSDPAAVMQDLLDSHEVVLP